MLFKLQYLFCHVVSTGYHAYHPSTVRHVSHPHSAGCKFSLVKPAQHTSMSPSLLLVSIHEPIWHNFHDMLHHSSSLILSCFFHWKSSILQKTQTRLYFIHPCSIPNLSFVPGAYVPKSLFYTTSGIWIYHLICNFNFGNMHMQYILNFW